MTTKIQKKNAFAKLNLILNVLNKRTDNYHNIFSLFHRIDLHDVITVEPSDKLQVQCDIDLGINESENIVYKAAAALNEYLDTNHTAKLTIQKNIPSGAGLGGGSSNAATTLLLLNNFWQLHLMPGALRSIAISLGADVPFFLTNTPQWAYGKGEMLEPFCLQSDMQPNNTFIAKYYVLIWPNIQINTALAYQKLERVLSDVSMNYDIADNLIATYSNKLNSNFNLFLPQIMHNDFEDSVFEIYPGVKKVFDKLTISSHGMARLTGSGSAVFALYDTLQQAEIAKYNMLKDFPAMNYKIFVGKLIA